MRIEALVFGERVDWDATAKRLIVELEVRDSLTLYNPAPDRIIEWASGFHVTGLPVGADVVAFMEVSHEDVGKWVSYPEVKTTLGPTDSYWVHGGGGMTFPAGREGVYRFRLTVKAGGESVRMVRKIRVNHSKRPIGLA